MKVVKQNRLLDAQKLLEDGTIILSRFNNSDIVPYNFYIDKVSKDEIYIRYGQLNSSKKINGIGRKICLRPKGNPIESYDEEKSYIDEG